mgnify:CR=1 FL=1
MGAGRPSELTAEMIPVAAEIAAKCPSISAIARGLGVTTHTIRNWMRKGETDESDSLHAQFFTAIHAALLDGEKYLSLKLFNGDGKDAAWLLTHSPFFRDEWSDAAATRREVQAVLSTVVQAIQGSDLTPEQQDHLLLRMQAAGLGAAAG